MKKFPKSWMEKQSKSDLIQILEARCVTDDALLDYLKLKAAAANPSKPLVEIKKSIRNAFWIDDFVEWNAVSSYTTQLDDVVETLQEMLHQGQAEVVVELVDEAFRCWIEAIDHIHCDGEMGMVLDELHDLHLLASQQSNPDPIALAEELFAVGSSSAWNIFESAYSAYFDVLGEEGRKHYQKRTEEKWKTLPVLKPKESDPTRCETRAGWLDRLMIQFAQDAGDFDREVEIRKRDLSNDWNFLKLAERYVEEKLLDEALAWVENGLHHFIDSVPLQRICAELYQKTKRPNDALLVWWNLFEASQTLETYQKLITEAGEIRKRTKWQTKAIDSIRKTIAATQTKKQSYWNQKDNSLLVEVFLWEGDPEQAWIEAKAGGCFVPLWVKLCKKREADFPDQVYPVYMQLAEQIVMRKNNDAYHDAIKQIKCARHLAEECEQPTAFAAMLSKIKMMHKPKRNFMKYLTEAGL